ncbi:TonB-dependent hemoglobin/transferrin/lactoferrin family receptor [Ottowia testudinis]|uniref:TonB-dependent hemoglobin/transferrin/lactoferrin family receptor n=1 Tax=Ottowia testudinis TaxID=2816950 RepID=A0A975CF17_9BURK|nr:TonB-dependent hemoglobin/transferrin/lactoferrin family receptor [Ottowia testudinis]QTD44349.1 TonB-dependent hemoglobin/transferrin/lactoferrin family receptor [Ottowia testudinis]
MLRMNPLALALAMAWGASPLLAAAEQPSHTPDKEQATPLKEVTVTATRTERAVDDVPATVTVTPRRAIEERDPRNLKDLLDDEVDLSVRAAPARFTAAGSATGRAGVEGINIRGLEGNQVLMTVDGIRVPNAFSFAAFSTGRGDYVAADGLKTVEVLRGPASTQFGSDGLAGAVSFRTLDPSDLLKGDANFGGFARTGYASVDKSWNGTLGVAGKSGGWQTLLLGSYRRGHETANMGSNSSLNGDRTAPNPLDYDNGYLLGKALYTVNSAHQLGLTLESLRRKQDTEVFSARAKPPLTATSVIGLQAQDRVARDRVSLEHRYTDLNAAWVQRAETKLYWQGAHVSQLSLEDRHTAADRTRDNHYRSNVAGLSTLLESNFSAPVNQRLTYGFDVSRAQIQATRDGTVPPVGEKFPTKPFPDTAYTLAGAFVQSEMEFGAVSVIPGLRFDHYALKPSAAGYTGQLAKLSDQAVSPRLGVVWRLNPAFAPYAQWAKGFRAPTPDQVNNGFTNPVMGYASVGNPNLKAERANSFEIGARGALGDLRYSVAAFDNRYDNFISQQVVGGAGTAANPTVFQYVNLARARIRGAEARAEWAVAKDWTLNAGLAYTKGESEAGGVTTPLDSVNPLKAVLGVRYDAARWGMQANAVYSGKKAANSVSPAMSNTGAPTPAFIPAAATVVDVGAYFKPMRNLTIHARIGNLFNTKYWRWADVRGLAANSAVVDAYTGAGRNVQVSMKYEF